MLAAVLLPLQPFSDGYCGAFTPDIFKEFLGIQPWQVCRQSHPQAFQQRLKQPRHCGVQLLEQWPEQLQSATLLLPGLGQKRCNVHFFGIRLCKGAFNFKPMLFAQIQKCRADSSAERIKGYNNTGLRGKAGI